MSVSKKNICWMLLVAAKHANDPGPALPRGWGWFHGEWSLSSPPRFTLAPFQTRLPPRPPSPQTARWMPLLEEGEASHPGPYIPPPPVFYCPVSLCPFSWCACLLGLEMLLQVGKTTSISRGGWGSNPLSESTTWVSGQEWVKGSEKYRLLVTGRVLGMDCWGQQHGDCC